DLELSVKSFAFAALAAVSALALSQTAFAQSNAPAQGQGNGRDGDVVTVFGRALEQVGDAQSASEGVVGYADLSVRPISRAAELVEVIPGMIATEHSSGGKANQYFM